MVGTTVWNYEPITPSFLKLLLSGYLIAAIGNGTKTDPKKQAYSAMEVCMQLVHREVDSSKTGVSVQAYLGF